MQADILDVVPNLQSRMQVEVADVRLAQRIARGELMPDATQLLRGDVAPIGAVNAAIYLADRLLIKRKALGEPVGF